MAATSSSTITATPLFVNEGYWGCTYTFDTTRKALSVLESLLSEPIPGITGSASSGGHHASRAEGKGFCTFNWVAGAAVHALELGARRENYLPTVEEALTHAAGLEHDFVVYNAGMDIMNAGVRPEVAAVREQMVREFIGDTPAVFGFAGGYSAGRGMEAVVEWHRLTLGAWASKG